VRTTAFRWIILGAEIFAPPLSSWLLDSGS
jgi:hypothetical protein